MSFLATTYSSSNNGRNLRQRSAHKDSSRQRQTTVKKTTPRVSNSFCFNLSSKIFKNSRSVSRERTRQLSLTNTTPSNRRSNSIHIYGLNSSVKLLSGHPGLQEFEESREFRLKNEKISLWLENARAEMKSNHYDGAIKELGKILKIDPSHPKALFLRASCFISEKKHKLAIPDLLSVIQEDPKYEKKVYIALAICFVEVDDYTTAIRQLTKCISIFPNFAEGYLNRGILFNRQQRWDKAVTDFHEAISLSPQKGSSYLGLCDTLIGMGDIKSSLKILKSAFQDASSLPIALLKRGKIYFDQQKYNKALKDINQVLDIQSENVEAFYYKAFALLGLNKLTDAALCLEQVVKFDSMKKYTGAAIYNLGAIRIKQKDYYGAMFTFQRSVDLGLEIEEQKILKNYVEAILSLMKRKFKEGVNILTRIIKTKNPLIKEYIGNCFAFRGYAYASLEEHEKALKDLNMASSLQALDKSSEYNQIVSKAVIVADKEPEEALKLFEEAGKIFPISIEPKLYSAAIDFALAQHKNRSEFAEFSKELLDNCIKVRDSESDIYFFRGIVHFYLGKIKEAIHDIEQAIDKAEDNVVDHFLARGVCSARLKMYKEAIQDFCIAIQLNEKCSEAFFFRGRCAFILDETEMAFEDFQKLTTLKPDDPTVHINAGNILMITGEIENALKAYANACKNKPVAEAYIQRAKCYLLLENLNEALQELKYCVKIKQSPMLNYDIEVLEILQHAPSKDNLKQGLVKTIGHFNKIQGYKNEGNIVKNEHVHWYKGTFLFFLGDFQKAKSEFKQAATNKDDSDDETMEKDNIELLYNISLIYIVGEYYEAAYNHLKEIVNLLEGKDRGKVLMLMGILQNGLEQQKDARSLIAEGSKFDPETVQQYLEQKGEVKILPLSSNSKYASNFPMVKVKIGSSTPVLIRPSFSLPKIDMPRMEFESEQAIFDKFIVKSVKCKPETPWLNRVKGSIQFTDEIQNIECESLNESQEPAIKIEESENFYSDATMRKYKSESISLGENEVESHNMTKSSESLIEGELEDLEDLEDIEFY